MPFANPKTDFAPPTTDSGFAWCIVAAAFVAGFVVFGIVYSFGVFLQPLMVEFRANRAAASAYYAIANLTFCMLGPLGGHIADRLGPHVVTAFGSIAMASGLIATAFIEQLWTGYATYGIVLTQRDGSRPCQVQRTTFFDSIGQKEKNSN